MLLTGDDVDKTAASFFLKLDSAVFERIESVVAADSYMGARVKLGAPLANDDLAGFDVLSTKDFDS